MAVIAAQAARCRGRQGIEPAPLARRPSGRETEVDVKRNGIRIAALLFAAIATGSELLAIAWLAEGSVARAANQELGLPLLVSTPAGSREDISLSKCRIVVTVSTGFAPGCGGCGADRCLY